MRTIALLIGTACTFGWETAPLTAQEPAVNPHIGHHHHHLTHRPPHPAAEPSPTRFFTTREAAKALRLPAADGAFQFVVFGDRTGGPPGGVAVLADAVRDVKLLDPDLVITVGDMVQGYNEQPDWLAQTAEFKSVMDQLACPWFPVAGNHDTYWRGKPGVPRPPGEHEQLYELHFGPLWYAFEHKNCWFLALYSDEGNPATVVKDFNDPAAQRLSAAQFEWLRQTLAKARGADHVFLFLHHPRWLKADFPHYGDDWDRVHELLKSAGNVTAVFGGHIHRMRSDGPRDGIEYFTLATTGGQLPGHGAAFGFLHHYDVVTVRKDSISLAAVPVGTLLDPREMTADLVNRALAFSRQPLEPAPPLVVQGDGTTAGEVALELANPCAHPVEVTVAAASDDSRWSFAPDHHHATLAPGGSARVQFSARRAAAPLDETFRDPTLVVAAACLAPGFRYELPERQVMIPLTPDPAARAAMPNRALHFNGTDDWLAVDSAAFDPGEALTLECRFKADLFGDRTGLVTKTEGSDYGLFVSHGRPEFSIFIGDSYLNARAATPVLRPGTWHHLAGVYDGREARLYLDGSLLASEPREGRRKRNQLPLVIGADVTRDGGATSHFTGAIDYVRVSRVPRYLGPQAAAAAQPAPDPDTCLLLQLDELLGLRTLDSSASNAHAARHGSPAFVPAR